MGSERRITVRVSPEVALFFVEQEGRRFAELEKRFKLSVDLKDDPELKRGDMRVFTAKKSDITKQVVGNGGRDLATFSARPPTAVSAISPLDAMARTK
jgi:hypothetical protein